MDQDIKYMSLAYKEALKALKNDEVPVGAIIVKDDKVIARAYNNRESKQMVTAHAETLVIEKACKKLNSWRLDDCTLYTTLEPCIMCSGVIIHSRIKRVVYGASETKWLSLNSIIKNNSNLSNYPEVTGNILKDDCSNLIKKYFINKR